MQQPFSNRSYHPRFTNYKVGEDEWFPSHPDCPNHEAGVPFSSAFSNPNSVGQVSCAGCFLHSRIIQSMAMSCQHLHANANCSNCYHHGNPQTSDRQDISPQLHSCHSSPITNISPPIFPHEDKTLYPADSRNVYHSNSPNRSEPSNPNSPQNYCNSSYLQQNSDFIGREMSTSVTRSSVSSTISASYFPGKSSLPIPQNFEQEMKSLKDVSPQRDNSSSLENESEQRKSERSHNTRNMKQDATRKRSATDVCEVCGDRASGYHYNALTCEGCKGFFRRSINRKEPLFRCKFGGSCEMDTYTRRKCPECRLKKCRAVGMLEECLLTEIQCQSKRRIKSTKKQKQINNSTSTARIPATVNDRVATNTPVKDDLPQESHSCPSLEEELLVSYVGTAFNQYANNPELVKGWDSYLERRKSHKSPNLSELATSHVQVLVEFTKKLPGFQEITAEDQIGLLKGSVVEIMLLRNAYSYNQKNGNIDISALASDTATQEKHFRCVLDFFHKVEKLSLDRVEYGLLISIILFDCDHANTNDKSNIEKHRDLYLSAMKAYSEGRSPKRVQVVAKILNLITELRTLYSTHAKMVSNFRMKEELSPLLREVWDIQ